MAKKIEKPILEVNNLRISFTTYNGTVKAVRGIDFALYQGRTLAIVGESGSGKSVSSKAIMGLLAGNKIVEDGSILFDGKDLLKLSDDEFVSIRGSRIAMIFQDPMSSLNPIMRVGKQLSEVMILKEKTLRKLARANLARITSGLKTGSLRMVSGGETALYLSNLKKAYMGNEEFNQELLEVNTTAIVQGNQNIYKEKLAAVIDYLKSIEGKYLTDAYTFDVDAFSKERANFKAQIRTVINPLELSKDTLLWTANGEYKSLVKKYHDTVKKIKKDNSFQIAMNKKEQKGKDTEQDILKHQSFASEIPLDTDLVFNAIKDYIDRIIKHLEDLLNDKSFDAKKSYEALFNFLVENYKQSLSSITKNEAKARSIELLKEVGIPEPEKRFRQYPFELSGGMRQRIVIAIGLASNPEILICDEPTTALDVTIQAQILELINDLKAKRNLSIIFITHNLGVVANMADDIAVMYAGKIVEYGTANDVFYHPAHPYTWALLASMPDLNSKERLQSIPGTPPNMILPPVGDAFAARNKDALEIDFEKEPPLFEVSEGHYAATWLLVDGAPKINPPKIVTERIRINMEKNGLIAKKGGKK